MSMSNSELNILSARIEKYQKEIRILHKAALIFNTSLELPRTLERLLEVLQEVIDFQYCSVYLRRTDEASYEKALESKRSSFKSEDSFEIVLKVAQSGLVLYIEGEFTEIFLPLKREEEVIGVIHLVAEEDEEIEDDEKHLLVNIARQAAMAIKNAQLFEKINEMAITDGLTRLYNRQYYEVIFERERQRLARNSLGLGVVMIDINGLKDVNDNFGHVVGDYLIREVSFVIKASVRIVDFVFRFGGDEMVILLPDIDEGGVDQVVRRLEDNIMLWNKGIRKYPIEMSMSIGKAWCDALEESGALLQVADKRMYDAKEQYYEYKLKEYYQGNF